MTRRSFFFDCEGSQCAATLNVPPNGVDACTTGLLIVTGGNELRSGPHSSQAQMAAHFADLGFPVFRYDRRGVGDSAGENTGWRGAEADVRLAAAAFRVACPALTNITGYGNCDGASSLAFYGHAAGLSRIILANPWVFDHDGESSGNGPSNARPEHSRASALRYYRQRLGHPVGLLRDLFSGKINLGQAIGDAAALGHSATATTTASQLAEHLTSWGGNATLVLAEGDRTALYFQEQIATLKQKIAKQTCTTSSHSFADDAARAWLYAQIEAVLTAA